MEEKLIEASIHLWKSVLNKRLEDVSTFLAFEVTVFAPILGTYLLFHQELSYPQIRYLDFLSLKDFLLSEYSSNLYSLPTQVEIHFLFMYILLRN